MAPVAALAILQRHRIAYSGLKMGHTQDDEALEKDLQGFL